MLRFEITRGWLLSEAGRQAKIDNEAGYRNVLLYAKMYKQMLMMSPMGTTGSPESVGAGNLEKPTDPSLKNAPIQGENNVATVQ